MEKTRSRGVRLCALALIALCVFAVFTLTACNKDPKVAEYSVKEDSIPDVVVAGGFNYTSLILLVRYEGREEFEEVASAPVMFNTEARNALNTPGEQQVTIFFDAKPAVFTVFVVEEGTETYTVTFHANGERLKRKTAVVGTTVVAPEAPEVGGQVFAGWATEGGVRVNLADLSAHLDENKHVNLFAEYTENVANHTVNFVDYTGRTISTQTVRHGDKVTPPSWTKPAEIATVDWGVDFSTYVVTNNVTFNMTVTYVERTVNYAYAFESSPSVRNTLNGVFESVRIGGSATKTNEALSAINRLGLTFIRWQNSTSNITSDTTIVAIVADRYFNVSVRDADGNVLTSAQVRSGESFSLANVTVPSRPGYLFLQKFTCNGREYSGRVTISSDMVFTPVYQRKQAKIQFIINFAGSEVREQTVSPTDKFYGDKVDFEYVESVVNGVIASLTDKGLEGYLVERFSFKGEDVTAAPVTLEEQAGGEFLVFSVEARNPQSGTGLTFTANAEKTGYIVSGYDKESPAIYIPETYRDSSVSSEALPVIGIAEIVFKDAEIVKLVIPASVKSIGNGAFEGAVFHCDIVLPDLDSFGNGVFKNASTTEEDGLNVTFGENSTFTVLDGDTFADAQGHASIVLPASVTEITDRTVAVTGEIANGIIAINLDNVTRIGKNVFAGNEVADFGSLNKVVYVGDNAFAGSFATALSLPNVTELGSNAFKGMEKLEALSVATAAENANLTFDLKSIDGNNALKTLILGKGVKSVVCGGAVNANLLAIIELSESLSAISDTDAFLNFPSLKEIKVAEANANYASVGGVLFAIEGAAEKSAVLKHFPTGKSGDYSVPNEVKGAAMTKISADFTDVRINTLTFNDAFISAFVAAGGAGYELRGLGKNSAVNAVINGSLLGEGEAFVGNLTAVLEKLNVARYYHITDAPADLKDKVEENGWENKVFEYGDGKALSVYDEATGLVYRTENGAATVLFGDSGAEVISVPATLGGAPVRYIAENAFANIVALKELSINAVIDGTFAANIIYGCGNLEKFTVTGFADTVVFEGFESDEFMATPFGSSKNLVVLGNRVVVYNEIEGNETIVTEEDLAGVTAIGDVSGSMNRTLSPFAGKNITEVYLPETVTAIGFRAFADSKIEKIVMGGVQTVGEGAFANTLLTEVLLPSVTRMGAGVFEGSANLESVTISNSVNSGMLPVATFKDCVKLVNVSLSNIFGLDVDNEGNSSAFYGCAALTDISFAKQFESIPKMAFYGCSSIKIMDTTGSSVKAIGDSAFADCAGLTTVRLTSDVTKVGINAFGNCTGLLSVKITGTGGILGTDGEVGAGAFPLTGNYKIYVSRDANTNNISDWESFVTRDFPTVNFVMYEDYAADGEALAPLVDIIYLDEAPTAPTFEGYTFDAWYIRRPFGQEFVYELASFPMEINESLTLAAKYINDKRGTLGYGDVLYDADSNSYHLVRYTNVEDVHVFIPSVYGGEYGELPITVVYSSAFLRCEALKELVLPEGVVELRAGVYDPSDYPEMPNAGSSMPTFNKNLEYIFLPASLTTINGYVFTDLTNLDIEFAEGSKLYKILNVETTNKNEADEIIPISRPKVWQAFEGSKWYENEKAAALEGKDNGFVIAGRLIINHFLHNETGVVELPNNTFALADGLLAGDTHIREIILNDSLEYIGELCFAYASNLMYITYASGNGNNSLVSDIQRETVEGTPWLTSRDLAIVGTVLVRYTSRSGATSVTIPKEITEISDRAFENATVQEVIFEQGSALKKIGDRAFASSAIRSIALPSSVKEMGKYVFFDCQYMETADLGSVNIEILPEGTFMSSQEGGNRLKALYLSPETKYLAINSLIKCSNLETIVASGVISGIDAQGNINANAFVPAGKRGDDVPDTIGRVGITDTAYYARARESTAHSFITIGKILLLYLDGTDVGQDNEIEEAEIPEGIATIIGYAFEGKRINVLTIPESVTTIAGKAFFNCAQLTDVKFTGSGLTEIGEQAFAFCESLKTIALPDGLLTIGDNAFANCNELRDLEVPDSVTSIGHRAFADMARLGSVKLSAGLKNVGGNLFENDPQLYKVVWHIANEDFDELNANIVASFGAGVTKTKKELVKFTNDMFNAPGNIKPRMYLTSALVNYIEASQEDGNAGTAASYAAAWSSGAISLIGTERTYNLLIDGTYPTVSFDNRGYYMPSFKTEVITSLDTPAKTGHTFVKWWIGNPDENPDATVLDLSVEPYPLYNDITLYAEFFANDADESFTDFDFRETEDGTGYIIDAINVATPVSEQEHTVGGADFIINEGYETLYIPATYNGKRVVAIDLGRSDYEFDTGYGKTTRMKLKSVVGVKKIIFTQAGFFKDIQQNFLGHFPDLETVEVLSDGVNLPNMQVIDGVVYNTDGTILISYLAQYEMRNGEYIIQNGERIRKTDFTIPDTVVEILPFAFSNSGLTDIHVGKGVKKIGTNAFSVTANTFTFDSEIAMTDVDSSSFSNTAWFYDQNNWTLYTYEGRTYGMFFAAANVLLTFWMQAQSANLVIPDSINGFDITVIASNLKMENDRQHETYDYAVLTLPSKLQRINSRAFDNIDVSQNIVYNGSTLNYIANDVFGHTEYYQSNNSDRLILGNVLLKYVSTSANVEVPEGIIAISNRAFEGSQVRTVTLPRSLQYIGDRAFYACTNLQSVNIPDNVTVIGSEAFGSCQSLTSVAFNDATSKLIEIGDKAFINDYRLTSLSIPFTVESIGAEAFNGCRSLASVTFDYIVTTDNDGVITTEIRAVSHLKELGESAFYNNTSLRSINIPNGLTELKSETFYNCTSLATVNFDVDRSRIKTISERAFANCSSLGGRVDVNNPDLVTVVLPNSLETIKARAFENCSEMLGIRLNYSVKTIEEYAFIGCTRMTKLDIYRATPIELSDRALDRVEEGGTARYNLRIYVTPDPTHTILTRYKEAWGGSYANNIYERGDLPQLIYRRPSGGTSGAGQDQLSDPVYADVIINPNYTFGTSTYVEWTYHEIYSATDGSVSNSRLNANIKSVSGQVQTEGATDYTVLIVDYDRITLTIAG